MRAAFADAAIGDDGIFPVDPFSVVERLERVRRFERAIFIGGLRPGNARGAGNVAARAARFPSCPEAR